MPSMIRLLAYAGVLSITAAVGAQQPNRDAAVRPAIGTASISGTIVTDEPNGRPIRRVLVTLSGAAGVSTQRLTTTDDNGRFAFTRLPAGNYAAPRATKPGYVTVTYGQKRPGGIGTPITLAEGQHLTLPLKMMRGAVITGTVFDQANKPAAQTTVQASLMTIVNGQRTPTQYSIGNTSATTDDRGVYRIYGLAPGDYIVAASPRFTTSGETRPITEAEIRWAQQQRQMQNGPTTSAPSPVSAATPPKPAQAISYTQVYYSGTPEIANASLVTVAAGQERAGIDFAVQFVSTAKIEGTLLDESGQPPQNAQVNIIPKLESSAMINDFMMMESLLFARPTVVNGKFTMTGVKPGQYTITARAAPASAGGAGARTTPGGRGGAAPPMTLWAMTDVTVDGNDQSGITLRLEPGMTMTGRITFDGAMLQPPTDLSRVSIRLSAAPSTGPVVTVTVGASTTPVAADGTFKIKGVTPGRYLLSSFAPAATTVPGVTWVVKSAVINGVDVADVPLDVKPGQDLSGVVVTFTDKTAEVSGTLLDALGRPTPEYFVVMFPTDKSQWMQRARRMKPPTRTTNDGKFKFTGLLPGEYYLAALTDFEPNDINNPAFLEQVAAAAMKITVTEGEKKVQDMKIAGGEGSWSR
jgi:carboxypeptidase family protein